MNDFAGINSIHSTINYACAIVEYRCTTLYSALRFASDIIQICMKYFLERLQIWQYHSRFSKTMYKYFCTKITSSLTQLTVEKRKSNGYKIKTDQTASTRKQG